MKIWMFEIEEGKPKIIKALNEKEAIKKMLAWLNKNEPKIWAKTTLKEFTLDIVERGAYTMFGPCEEIC